MLDLARRAFGGLERDIADKAFGDHHVDHALPDVVAFDEAHVIEERQVALAQDLAGLAHLFQALHLLDPDIEQADGRALLAEQDARHRRAHHREIDQMRGIGADRGAEVEHDRLRRARSASAPRSPAGRSRPWS